MSAMSQGIQQCYTYTHQDPNLFFVVFNMTKSDKPTVLLQYVNLYRKIGRVLCCIAAEIDASGVV